MKHILKNEHYTVTVSDIGAEMVSLMSPSGLEMLWQGDPARDDYWQMQAPILFPICGSSRTGSFFYNEHEYPMEMHGFARASEFSLIEKTDNSLLFELHANEETKKSYPFDFTLRVGYLLSADKIAVKVTVRNDNSIEMPYMVGFHPGFNLPTGEGLDNEDYRLDFGELKSLVWCPSYIDGRFITSRVFDYPLPDSCYHINEAEILANDTMIFTGHGHRVKLYAPNHPYLLEMEWSDTLPTLCIWKQETHDAKMLCVEPWCLVDEDGITDNDFNRRIMPRLDPGECEEYSFTLRITL